jgi:hypothetical protein
MEQFFFYLLIFYFKRINCERGDVKVGSQILKSNFRKKKFIISYRLLGSNGAKYTVKHS